MIKSYRIIKSYLNAVGRQQYKISSNTLTQIVVFCIIIQKTSEIAKPKKHKQYEKKDDSIN